MGKTIYINIVKLYLSLSLYIYIYTYIHTYINKGLGGEKYHIVRTTTIVCYETNLCIEYFRRNRQ